MPAAVRACVIAYRRGHDTAAADQPERRARGGIRLRNDRDGLAVVTDRRLPRCRHCGRAFHAGLRGGPRYDRGARGYRHRAADVCAWDCIFAARPRTCRPRRDRRHAAAGRADDRRRLARRASVRIADCRVAVLWRDPRSEQLDGHPQVAARSWRDRLEPRSPAVVDVDRSGPRRRCPRRGAADSRGDRSRKRAVRTCAGRRHQTARGGRVHWRGHVRGTALRAADHGLRYETAVAGAVHRADCAAGARHRSVQRGHRSFSRARCIHGRTHVVRKRVRQTADGGDRAVSRPDHNAVFRVRRHDGRCRVSACARRRSARPGPARARRQVRGHAHGVAAVRARGTDAGLHERRHGANRRTQLPAGQRRAARRARSAMPPTISCSAPP